ncbi:hypothetical protein BLOT_008054, partial [Blomia tropicalis]
GNPTTIGWIPWLTILVEISIKNNWKRQQNNRKKTRRNDDETIVTFWQHAQLSIRSVRRTLLIVGKKVQYKLVYRLSIMHDFNIVRDGQRRRRRPVIPAQSSLEIGYHKG